jgi:aryl-alcohol dehydrogenase-like predicted oxidoreductase
MGTWALGGPVQAGAEPIGRGPVDAKQALETLHAARDRGVNFFDTADIYGLGRSEELLGRAFHKRWHNTIVGTKVGKMIGPQGDIVANFSAAHIIQSVENSLRRLRKGTIDLLQLHNPAPEVVQIPDVVACLESLQTAGKIRYWGVSVRIVPEGLQMIRDGFRGSSMQVVFNLLRQEAADEFLPLASNNEMGVIVRVPLEYGVLTGKFSRETTFPDTDHRSIHLLPRLAEELRRLDSLRFLEAGSHHNMAIAALRYCLSFSAVSTTIPGARTREQVAQNVTASDQGPLDAATLATLGQLYASDFRAPT